MGIINLFDLWRCSAIVADVIGDMVRVCLASSSANGDSNDRFVIVWCS